MLKRLLVFSLFLFVATLAVYLSLTTSIQSAVDRDTKLSPEEQKVIEELFLKNDLSTKFLVPFSIEESVTGIHVRAFQVYQDIPVYDTIIFHFDAISGELDSLSGDPASNVPLSEKTDNNLLIIRRALNDSAIEDEIYLNHVKRRTAINADTNYQVNPLVVALRARLNPEALGSQLPFSLWWRLNVKLVFFDKNASGSGGELSPRQAWVLAWVAETDGGPVLIVDAKTGETYYSSDLIIYDF